LFFRLDLAAAWENVGEVKSAVSAVRLASTAIYGVTGVGLWLSGVKAQAISVLLKIVSIKYLLEFVVIFPHFTRIRFCYVAIGFGQLESILVHYTEM